MTMMMICRRNPSPHRPPCAGRLAEATNSSVAAMSAPPGSAAVWNRPFPEPIPLPEMLVSFWRRTSARASPARKALPDFAIHPDNSLAVGPNHIVQIVNTRMAVFTKKGSKFDTTGRVLSRPG